jgi:hypothetical protein
MSYFRVKGHPILDAWVGWTATRAALRGSLFGTLVEANRIGQALTEHQQAKVAGCAEVARDAAIADAKLTGGDVEHAKAAAIAAGTECMAGPLFTGTIRPASPHDPATPPPPKPPNNVARAVVFIVAAVLGAIFAAKIVGGFHG